MHRPAISSRDTGDTHTALSLSGTKQPEEPHGWPLSAHSSSDPCSRSRSLFPSQLSAPKPVSLSLSWLDKSSRRALRLGFSQGLWAAPTRCAARGHPAPVCQGASRAPRGRAQERGFQGGPSWPDLASSPLPAEGPGMWCGHSPVQSSGSSPCWQVEEDGSAGRTVSAVSSTMMSTPSACLDKHSPQPGPQHCPPFRVNATLGGTSVTDTPRAAQSPVPVAQAWV